MEITHKKEEDNELNGMIGSIQDSLSELFLHLGEKFEDVKIQNSKDLFKKFFVEPLKLNNNFVIPLNNNYQTPLKDWIEIRYRGKLIAKIKCYFDEKF